MIQYGRRELILGSCVMLGLSASGIAQSSKRDGAIPAELLPLWPGRPPGGGGPFGRLLISAKGAIRNVGIPSLEVYRPRKPNGMAVLVAAGGGYKRIEMDKEARPAARWLTAHGVTAFVLRYRLPSEGWHDGALAPLQDAQRALRIIAARRDRYGLGRDRIGVLGFSAGGHLLGLAAARSAFASYHPVDEADGFSARPTRAALIYPVVTLMAPYDDTSTRVQMVGRHPTAADSAEWSIQTHVRGGCPPLFLVQAQDDRISNIANTAILEAAARQVGISVERHVLSTGGHGFGLGRLGSPSVEWPRWYEGWLGLG